MGNYHTNTNLKDRFEDDATVAQLTGADSAETGVPDEDVLTEVVNGSEGEVDSYLCTRYLIPVDVSDDTNLASRMRTVCLDISVYNLSKRDGAVVPQPVTDSYTAAIAWCKDVSTGKANIPSTATKPATETNEPQSEWGIAEVSDTSAKRNRVFTRDSMGAL